jgi:hypothetical protein
MAVEGDNKTKNSKTQSLRKLVDEEREKVRKVGTRSYENTRK